MATHSSIFAWRSPWTEQRGRLQPMGLDRSERFTHTSYVASVIKKDVNTLQIHKTPVQASSLDLVLYDLVYLSQGEAGAWKADSIVVKS